MNAFFVIDRWTARVRDAAIKAGKRKIQGWVKAHMRKGSPVKAHQRKTQKKAPVKKRAPAKKRTPRSPTYLPNPAGAAIQAHLDREWKAARRDPLGLHPDGNDEWT